MIAVGLTGRQIPAWKHQVGLRDKDEDWFMHVGADLQSVNADGLDCRSTGIRHVIAFQRSAGTKSRMDEKTIERLGNWFDRIHVSGKKSRRLGFSGRKHVLGDQWAQQPGVA